MAFFNTKIEGLKELDKALHDLDDKALHWKVLRKAMRKEMTPVRNMARSRYAGLKGRGSESIGNLSRQLKIFTSRKFQSVSVGWRWPKNATFKQSLKLADAGLFDPYYAFWVENGFTHPKSGQRVNGPEGKGFLRSAFDVHDQTFVPGFTSTIDKELTAVWKKKR